MLGLSKSAHREVMAERYIGPSQGRNKGRGQDHALARSGDRGRNAEHPRELPRSGWRDILWRGQDETAQDKNTLIAARGALFPLLASFPPPSATAAVSVPVAHPARGPRHLPPGRGRVPR